MGRTNIDIDEHACRLVMERYGCKTKREAVNLALRKLAIVPMSLEEALAMRGTGWEGDLDELTRVHHPDAIADLQVAEGAIASLTITEPTAGSDATGMKTEFRPDGDSIVINGSKLI